MNRKKIIITGVSVLVAAALTGGGIGGYRWYQSKNLIAKVQSVSNLNLGGDAGNMSSSGMVTNDQAQEVYLLENQSIKEVFVQEGQTVAVGDPLISYDMTMTNLQTEMKQLDVDTFHTKLEAARRELEKLKKTKPVSSLPITPQPQPEPEPEPEPTPPQPGGNTPHVTLPEKSGEAYNYISEEAVPQNGAGTEPDPYVFLCMPDAYVLGSYLNSLSDDPQNPVSASFEIRQGNTFSGPLISCWKISGSSGMPVFEDDSRWSIFDRRQLSETEQMQEENPADRTDENDAAGYESAESDAVQEQPQGYTAKELAKKILDTETKIRDLDLSKRKAELELDQMKKVSADGVVASTVNGVVKKVGKKDHPPTDGTPFLTVSGSEGLYVSGYLSELLLGKVEKGQLVHANSWESGRSFEATITDISAYPQKDGNSGGDGNPNVSYYPYTAYIEDSEGLKNGEYVDLSISGRAEESAGICIEKAYVRQEGNKSYVMKEGEDGRLVKQYVETGKTIWGQSIVITSGLTLEDRIAFPYGKTAKEGVKVEEASDGIIQ